MAATDQTYRNQRSLDVVFGVSCLLMLFSVVWMFAQDYYREFKVDQREFRDVETALSERSMLSLLPDEDRKAKIEEAEQRLARALAVRNAVDRKLERQINAILPEKAEAEAEAQKYKADYDSLMSIYNIDIEKRNAAAESPGEYKVLAGRAEERLKEINKVKAKYDQWVVKVEQINQKLAEAKSPKSVKVVVDGKEEEVDAKEVYKEASDAEDHFKKLVADFDRFAKLTVQKRWKIGDAIRALPVIDGFASPTKIHQFTLDNLPINYNFKYVTRYDRCMTCHQGIDRAAYTRVALTELTQNPSDEQKTKLKNALAMLEKRRKVLKMQEASFDESDLPRLNRLPMSAARISEFAAHPRLDLFVDGNSPHSAEKFGCTICHEGQGSSTDFFNASHTPNDAVTRKRWETDGKHWHSNHYWDFPMLPSRFVESSCLKCHHQVTDLLPEGNKVEYRDEFKQVDGKPTRVRQEIAAPGAKVTQGYNIVRDFGCFGCHEISGTKGGRFVGPDLRVEPTPPIDDLPPDQRAKILADPLNAPGKMRKVGPSLRRIVEKTNETWVRQWIFDPRGFRPDTKMPHFYNVSNNNADALKGTGQENFPATEINALAFYLFRRSEDYVAGAKEKLPEPKLPDGYKEDKERGRQLFTERGCLACHSHHGTESAAGGIPAVKGDAHFGPNLSRIAAKLGAKPGDGSARKWLIQWIKNPTFHHPRTFMPVTHLDDAQAADVAAWLLSQEAKDWTAPEVPAPAIDDLKNLARVWLAKSETSIVVDDILPPKQGELAADKIQQILDPTSAGGIPSDQKIGEKLDVEGKLKLYVGRKALNQLGCFGCHDIPGFEQAKPIGTPLNDWGKKDPERLAFEDVSAYAEKHYYEVETKVNEKGHGYPKKDGKDSYEKFFLEALKHHQREGFLHQKLREPRSYDYDRIKSWEDRLRMPQFKFARGEGKPLSDEEAIDQAEQRAEAAAREAVMTFVLGLLAEPIPLKYVYDPQPDKKAEILGKQVVDKFNCGGCHQLRAGSFEFSTTRPDDEKRRVVPRDLEEIYNAVVGSEFAKGDHPFPGHNAWTGRLNANPDLVKAHGLPIPAEADKVRFRLTQALRFIRPADIELPAAERDKKAVDIPAVETVELAKEDLVYRAPVSGGIFTELLVPYLVARKAVNLDDDPKARSGLPPPLLREGERVQPSWLFQFLRNPYKIREITILRMPRFNMSEEEAMALVNYFAAVDKTENPGVVLTYPYLAIPQRDEGFMQAQSTSYSGRMKPDERKQRIDQLKPIWEKQLAGQSADLEARIAETKKSIDKTQEDEKKETDPIKKESLKKSREDVEKRLASLQAELGELKNFVAQPRAWEKDRSYFTDAYRLLTNKDLCLKCHQVGTMGQEPLGPRLDVLSERLRPEWTQRWIASPSRMIVYPIGFHPMPQNFPRSKTDYQSIFVGSSLEQATAVRDVLMIFPKVADMPENRGYRPPQGAGP